jgi:prephenate dehydratase
VYGVIPYVNEITGSIQVTLYLFKIVHYVREITGSI